MSHPVTCFKEVDSVRHVVDVLKHESHHGFPVVACREEEQAEVSVCLSVCVYVGVSVCERE